MKKFIISIALSMFFISCSEDDDNQNSPSIINPNYDKVVIVNEGNFQTANSSISVYTREDNQINNGLFSANNANRPLGDLAQSMVKIDSRFFIVVNNSNKIEAVNATDFSSVGSIDPITQPRFMLPINGQKAYVTESNFTASGNIYVINTTNYTIEKTIPTAGWTEEMTLVNNRVFVSNVFANEVWVYDADQDTIIAKIPTNKQPQKMVVDINGKVWVACTGGFNDGNPALVQIDPNNLSIIKTLELNDNTKSISELKINSSKDELVYILDDVFKISIMDTALATVPIITKGARSFYALGVDPRNDDIYLSDALDFVQKGVIYRFDKNGTELFNFKAEIIPGEFFFE